MSPFKQLGKLEYLSIFLLNKLILALNLEPSNYQADVLAILLHKTQTCSLHIYTHTHKQVKQTANDVAYTVKQYWNT